MGTRGLSLVEHQKRFGTDAIVFHRLGGRVGLHELLKLVHVGNLSDETDPVGSLRVAEGARRDAQLGEVLENPGSVRLKSLDQTTSLSDPGQVATLRTKVGRHARRK